MGQDGNDISATLKNYFSLNVLLEELQTTKVWSRAAFGTTKGPELEIVTNDKFAGFTWYLRRTPFWFSIG